MERTLHLHSGSLHYDFALQPPALGPPLVGLFSFRKRADWAKWSVRAFLVARFYSLKIKTLFPENFYSLKIFSHLLRTRVFSTLHTHTLSLSLSLSLSHTHTHTHTHRCSDREIAPKPVINPDRNDKGARMCRHCATGRRKDVHLFSTTKGEKNEVINQGARPFY